MVVCGIYSILHTETQRAYVGSAVNIKRRFREHKARLRHNKHHCIKLSRAWSKYGEQNFTFSILEIVAEHKDLVDREQFWIDKFDAYNVGFNTTPFAMSALGRKHKETSKAKTKLALVGRKHSPERIAAIKAGRQATLKATGHWSKTENAKNVAMRILATRETKQRKTKMWFDATQFDPSGVASQFPVGRHPVVIRSSKQQAVKDKPNEAMLILNLEVIDGPAKGTAGPYRLNLWNASEQAREIANRQLSAVCHVTATHHLADKVNICSEMFNKPFVIVVSQQQADARYTQIDGVLDMAGNQAVRGQVPSGQPAQGQPPMMQQQPQQQAPQPQSGPSWGGAPQGQPTQAAPSGPSWGGAPQAQQQAPAQTHAPSGPSWGGPPQGQPAPSAAPVSGQPSWASAPAGSGPSWGR